MKVKFLKSGVVPKDYPFPYKPEVAFVGRSNAGKSSLINALVGQKTAKVSSTPGKTRLLNFFEINEHVYLVDCPGYGFATGDREEVQMWRKMLETYLRDRKTLNGVFVIMDIRRDWNEEEEMLREWFDHHGIEWALVLNKADKLSKSQVLARRKELVGQVGDVPMFIASARTKAGLAEIRNLLMKEWS